eukprot:TRINITY_DN876_c0_g1_i1.p1 TRINITY_DN876_c0_g1~~TRINITY_DN876_c0_g1_i1.p1  ORF type:complete len:169 (-),score=28.07 TRINITY_DN876_c0_g1_i1:380-886(-)
MFSPKEQQQEVFKQQIELAIKLSKPLYLHDRDAAADFSSILAPYRGKVRGVVHCFTGTPETLKRYVEEFDFYIGITGWLCDNRRNADLLAAVVQCPVNRIVIETDAPWLIPRPYANKWNTRRNQPDAIWEVLHMLASVLKIDEKTLSKQLIANAIQIFGLRLNGASDS